MWGRMSDDQPSTEAARAAAPSSRTVAVTGVSGLLGQRLLPLLDGLTSVDRIIGLDVREPSRRVARLEFHLVDLAGVDAAPLFRGVDTLVHLAAIVGPILDGELARRVNVDATRRLLAAAERGRCTQDRAAIERDRVWRMAEQPGATRRVGDDPSEYRLRTGVARRRV